MKHFTMLMALTGLMSSSFAGTFEVLECQVNSTISYLNLDSQPIVTTTGTLHTGRFFAKAVAMTTFGQVSASFQAPTEYRWKVKYTPNGPSDTPSGTYYCMVEARNKSKAVSELAADGETSTYSKTEVWRGNVTPLTRFSELYDDHKDPRNNPVDGAIEEGGDSNVPWDYESGYYWPGVVFEQTPEGWIGWATVIDLTPSMQMNLNVDEYAGYMSRGIGYLKKEMHLFAVDLVQIDTPWDRN